MAFANHISKLQKMADQKFRQIKLSQLPSGFTNTRLALQQGGDLILKTLDLTEFINYINGQIPAAVTTVTVAEAQALIAASGLTTGTFYLVSNALSNTAEILLVATAANAFDPRGWRNGYVFFDYYVGADDGAGYMDINQNYVDEMSSGLGTAITGSNAVMYNQILNSGAVIEGAVASDFTNNRISNCTFNFDSTGGTVETINANYFNGGGTINVLSFGSLRDTWVNAADGITVTMQQVADIESCYIDALVENLDFGSSSPYASKTYRPGYSDFDITYLISGANLVDLTSLAYVGVVNLSSTNATETLDVFTNFPTNHPVRLIPEAGLKVTFMVESATIGLSIPYVVDGDAGDWIELTEVGGVIRMTNIQKNWPDTSVNTGNITLDPYYANYSFDGVTATWTLPALTSTYTVKWYIKNRGSGNLTINTTAAANEIWDTAATNTYVLAAGASIIIFNDSEYYTIQ